jgi:hypothetical protein
VPAYDVTAPDGRKFRINAPEGATQEQVIAYAQANMPKAQKAPAETFDPTEGMSGFDKFAAGTGKAMVDTWRGAKQLVGLGNQAEIDEAARLDAPLMDTGAGIAGNVVGNLATMIGPGAVAGAVGKAASLPKLVNAARAFTLPTTIKGAAAAGAGFGALQPVAEDDSRAQNMALGAVGGALGNAIPKAIGRVVSPNTSAEVQSLMRAGVTPTPGQILGGTAKALEEKAASVPILGDAIAGSQRRAVEEFNRAAYNRVLNPIGKTAGKETGNAGVAAVGDELSAAYDKLLPKLSARMDPDFATEYAALTQRLAAELPDSRARQFVNVADRYVMRRFDKDNVMTGVAFKKAESDLSRLSRSMSGSMDDEARQVGYAFRDLNASMRKMLERSNPELAPELRAINEGWANLVRVEGAAGRVGSKEGVFTPEGLRGAVKGADKSVRHRAFARGEALMQDLSDSGHKVLGGKYPDSGTAGRLAQIGSAVAIGFNPSILAGLAAGAGLYTKPGQVALAHLLAKRPESAGLLASMIRKPSPYLSAPGASLLLTE